MKRYQTIILFVAVLAVIIFGYSQFTPQKDTPCRGGWTYHLYGSWKAGNETGTFRRHILMHRTCLRCGHIQTKDSD